MYIEKLKIGSFGKLQDKEIDLFPGLNIIEGVNESGKTTIGEFIKYIFYGLSNKSTDGKISERKRHISWETNDASGSITLNKDGKRYRVERSTFLNSNSYKDTVKTIDLSDLSEIKIQTTPGEYFFGIPENVFIRTSYIRQCDGAFFNGETLGQQIENLLYSADENINTEKAISKLEEARRLLRHKKDDGGGLLNDLQREKENLEEKLTKSREAQEQILIKEGCLKETKELIEEKKKRHTYLGNVLKAFDAREEMKVLERIHSYENKIKELKTSYDNLAKEYSYNGFVPDEKYVKELEYAKSELLFAHKNTEDGLKNSAETPKISVPPYRDEYAEIKESGGKDVLFDDINASDRKVGKMLTVSAFLAVFALIFSLLTVFLGDKLGKFINIGWALSAVILVFAIIGVVFSLYRSARNKNTFRHFGCQNEREFFDLLDDFEEYEKSEIFRKENAESEKKKNMKLEERENKAMFDALKLLSKVNAESEKKYVCIIEKIEKLIPNLNGFISAKTKIEAEIDKNTEAKNAISCQIGDFSDGDTEKYRDFTIGKEELDAGRQEVRREYDFLIFEYDSLVGKANTLESELGVLRALNDEPAMLEAILNKTEKELEECTKMYDSYVLAIN